jgi:small subunit ribosomal protein S21
MFHAYIDSLAALWYRPRRLTPLQKTGGGELVWFFASRGCVPWRFYLKGRRTALVQIFVRDNNVEQALKALKKKMQREGTFREMKRRKFYEKPSEKRARQKAEAIRRARKLMRKKMQREGLL